MAIAIYWDGISSLFLIYREIQSVRIRATKPVVMLLVRLNVRLGVI